MKKIYLKLSDMIANSRAGRMRARPRLEMRPRTRTRTLSTTRIITYTSLVVVLLSIGLAVTINLSNPRIAYAAANGDYRSAASGTWNSTSTWEKYNGTSWAAASATPISADGVITIQSGHTITVSANVTVDQLVIDAGGEVDLNSGVTLTVANGSGTDMDVSGIFKNSGTVTINASAAIAFESSGKYQHNFSTTAGTIPTATWNSGSTCEVIGYTSNTSAPGGLQSFYNLTWNCPSQTGNINLAGGMTTVNGDITVSSTGSGQLRLGTSAFTLNANGNLNLSAGYLMLNTSNAQNATLNISGNYSQTGGTFNVTIGNNNTATINESGNWSQTGGTLTIGGNMTTNAQIVFNKSGTQTFTASGNTVTGNVDFTVNSGSTLDIGTSTVACRNFTVLSGSTLSVGSPNGIVTSGSPNINASGAPTFSTTSNYIFNGTSAQVTGTGFPATINNLTINNSSGVTLSGNVTVAGTLTLTSGIITTGSYELKTSSTSTSSITGYSSSNYIIGNFRRSVSASGSYDFPVGTASNYELVNLTFASMTGFTDIVASFTNSSPIDISLPLTSITVDGTSISDMLDYGYWTLTPNSSMTGGTYTVTLNEKGQTNSAGDAASYCVLKRANALSLWQSLGTHNNSTQSESGGTAVASRSALTSFSQFGIGRGAGPLPIELVYFYAKPSGSVVQFSWQTAAEINNDYFTIERSSNGIDFIALSTIDGAGNSSTALTYSATDENPSGGITYYRLKQTDFDGKFTYSKIKTVMFNAKNTEEIISISSVSPNPFKENFSASYSLQHDAEVTCVLMNSAGQEVYSEKQNAMRGNNRFDYNDGINLPAGIYFVRISFENNVQVKKIIRN